MVNTQEEAMSYLLVSDDNYFPGLVAQINSILKHSPKSKIYLVHNLSQENFSLIKDYIYKAEIFDETPWIHLPERSRHITKISLGRFQIDFIEEDYFFYMDTDIIQQKDFKLNKPKNIAIEIKAQPINPNIHHLDRFQLMRDFIFNNGGDTEKEGDFTLYADAIFYANKKWLIDVLRPKMIEVSKKYTEQNILQRWFDMQYFHTAICILGKDLVEDLPIKNAWMGLPFTKEEYPKFFKYKNTDDCELLHYCGPGKPWIKDVVMDRKIKGIWSDYYLGGPVRI